MKRQTALMNAAKEEAKLKLKLTEERAAKLELQKHEVLSEFHLKEAELCGKIKDFENLLEKKKLLDRKAEYYRRSLKAFESPEDKTSDKNNELQKETVEEITQQIKKYLPEHEEYIQNIEQINPSFFDSILKETGEKLSKQHLKYCICFAAGLSIKDVSRCCFVEQSSVHMIRYRLKRKFKLGIDDDIDLYLKKMRNK